MTDNEKTELPILPDVITAQLPTLYCRASLAAVENPNAGVNFDGDEVPVHISPLDDASLRVVPKTFRALFLPASPHGTLY